MVIDWWYKQTLFVSYFTELFLVHSKFYNDLNQTLSDSYFADFIFAYLSKFDIGPVTKADIFCYVFYWVDSGYIWYFTRFFSYTLCYFSPSWLWVYSVIRWWLKHTFCVRYFTKWFLGSLGNLPLIKADTIS